MTKVDVTLGLGNPFGVRVIESLAMTEHAEDWSRVRSPSRARRRQRQGHRQNIRAIEKPRRDAVMMDGGRTMVIHPVLAAEIRKQLSERVDRIAREVMMPLPLVEPAGELTLSALAESWRPTLWSGSPTIGMSPFFSWCPT